MTAPPSPGSILGIDHVVIAVANLDASMPAFTAIFGEPALVDGGADTGYRRAVFRLGTDDQKIEICQPLAEDEPGGQSQASRAFRHRLLASGEGIHNLAVRVPSVAAARAAARAGGARVIESAHSDSYFIHPSWMSGVLVQFLER